jgi:hypothetical protein
MIKEQKVVDHRPRPKDGVPANPPAPGAAAVKPELEKTA